MGAFAAVWQSHIGVLSFLPAVLPTQVIECVPTQHITNLLDTFSGNLVSLSHHPFGCRVMQRILEHCTDQARYDSFMAEILKVLVRFHRFHMLSFAQHVYSGPHPIQTW